MEEGLYRGNWFLDRYIKLSHWLYKGLLKRQNYIALTNDMKRIMAFRNTFVKPHFCSAKPKGQHKGNYFLYVGRLTEEKGIRLALNAGLGKRLYVIGTGPLLEEVKNSDCTYIGHFNNGADQIRGYMNDAKALIFPSQWEEPFGMVAIEALSVGLPVIGARRGAIKHIINHRYNGLLFDDLEGLKKCLTMITPEMYNNAYESHKDYTTERNYQQLMAIYNFDNTRERYSSKLKYMLDQKEKPQ